jgi:hypothetical protein
MAQTDQQGCNEREHSKEHPSLSSTQDGLRTIPSLYSTYTFSIQIYGGDRMMIIRHVRGPITMMSTIEVVTRPVFGNTNDQADPYRYGWRYVRRENPDGSSTMEQVPLTLEDVLHPQEGDQVTQSDAHQRRRRYLCNGLEAQLADDPTAVVLDDVRVA